MNEGAGAAIEEGFEQLPLLELDRCVAPVRRTVAWAAADLDARARALQFLEATAGRWLMLAEGLDLPTPVRELVGEARANLDGFDRSVEEDRRRRLTGLNQCLSRIDALLGLPVPRRLLRPQPRDQGEEPTEEPRGAAGRTPSRARGGRGAPRGSDSEAADPGEATPTRRSPDSELETHLGSWNGLLGAPLEACGLGDELLAALLDAGLNTAGELLVLRPVEEDILPIVGAGRELPQERFASERANEREFASSAGELPATPASQPPDLTDARADAPEFALAGRVVGRASRLARGTVTNLIVLRGADLVTVELLDRALFAAAQQGARVIFVCSRRPAAAPGRPVLVAEELAFEGVKQQVRLARYAVPGLADRDVRAAIGSLLGKGLPVQDILPVDVRTREGLPELGPSLIAVHLHPFEGGEAARRRLAFDEALLAWLGLAWSRYQATQDRGIPHLIQHAQASRLVASEGGDSLTDPQELALDDIKRDLRGTMPMRRVLVGEVGSGRGMIGLMAVTIVGQAKSQALCISASRAAAEQHFAMAEPLLREAGMIARLVEPGTRRTQLDAIGRGEIHVVFGWPELLDEELPFRRLGLVLVEERESFGRSVDALARLRSPRPHLLVIPTTPVGLALTMRAYPDFDVTEVQRTPGRLVQVAIGEAGARSYIYLRARACLEAGGQAMVAFPLVRGADALDMREAMRMVHALQAEAFAGYEVVLYHGALSRDDRRKVVDDFQHRRGHVLVATTLVEDGPAIPGVGFLIVEQAERVDAVRLHRLQGFLTGSMVESPTVALIVGEMAGEGASERLREVMAGPSGYDVHEREVRERGLDALVAPRPPLPQLAWLDPTTDRELGWRANATAHAILRSDPGLRRAPSSRLAQALRDAWSQLWPDDAECPVPEGSSDRRRRRRRRRRR